MMTGKADPADVTGFWTGQDPKVWFTADPAFDAEVTRRFKGLLDQARSGALDAWSETPEGTLALVILLDQMSRNVYRGRPGMYGGDAKALGLAKHAIARGFDQSLPAEQRRWLYMPFMHSEDLADQEAGVDLFRRAGLDDNVPYAIEHADIIRRFGRFPHRNAILGRDSTPEEESFLADGGFAG